MTDNLIISTPFWFHIWVNKDKKAYFFSFNLISIFGFWRGLLLDRLKNLVQKNYAQFLSGRNHVYLIPAPYILGELSYITASGG